MLTVKISHGGNEANRICCPHPRSSEQSLHDTPSQSKPLSVFIAGMEDEVQLQHHPGAVQPDPEGPVPDIEGSASLHVNAVPKVGEHAAEVSFIPTCQGG